MTALTLYDIESKLAELLAIEASILEDPERPEADRSLALAAVNREIEEYFSREVKKVDGGAHAIRTYQFAAGAASQEAERIRARAVRLQETADRIKANVIQALQAHGIKRVETPTNVLRLQGNGGLAPLVIDDPSKLPLGLKIATMKVTGEVLVWLKDYCSGKGVPEKLALAVERAEHTLEPDGERIRAAIAAGEEVPAHLAERGVHLRLG